MKKTLLILCLGVLMFSASACGKQTDTPSIEELENTMPEGLLNYSLFTSNMTIDYDTSYVKDLEIENVQSNGDSCTVKAKVSLGGKYMDRVLYCNLECQKYDISGWEVVGFTEYGKEEIVINQLPPVYDLLHLNCFIENEFIDNTSYTDNTYAFTYTYQMEYSYALEKNVADATGMITRQDNAHTTDNIEYECDTNISYNTPAQYTLKEDAISGTWASEDYENWAVGILSVSDITLKWVALSYLPSESITTNIEAGGISGTDTWTIDEENEYLCQDAEIYYQYWDAWDNLCDRTYFITIKIPLNRNEDCIYLYYSKDTDSATNYSELYKYDAYNVSAKYDKYLNGTPISNSEPDMEETIDDTESVVDGIFNRNGFYGVWLYASDNEEDAYNFANQLSEQGFAGCVTQSNWWSNLNSEPYYVVTYGVYETEEIAQGQLENIQDLYSDAYVKFSGEYVGD